MKQVSLTNLSILTEIERITCVIQHIAVEKQHKKQLQSETNYKNLHFFMKALNFNIGEDKLFKILNGKTLDSDSPYVHLITNYNHVVTLIKNHSGNPLNLNFIQHINKLLSNNIVEIWNQGRIRNPQDKEIQLDYNFIAYKLKQNTTYKIDDINLLLLQPPEIIYSFLTMDILLKTLPFYTLNLATALLASYAVIFNTHYQANSYFSYIELLYEYLSTFWTPEKKALEYNLQRFLVLFNKQMIATKRQLEQYKKIPYSKMKLLNKRQKYILSYLQKEIRVHRREYARIFNIAPETAFRDLKQLVKLGILKRQGNGRSVSYVLKNL